MGFRCVCSFVVCSYFVMTMTSYLGRESFGALCLWFESSLLCFIIRVKVVEGPTCDPTCRPVIQCYVRY